MTELFSHPKKPLREHLNEVSEAAEIIASSHSPTDNFRKLLEQLVKLHDFGKGTRFFQEYIKSKPTPLAWTGRKEDKSHTLIGLLATTKLKEQNNFSNEWLLQVGTSILGHHTLLPTCEDIDKRFYSAFKVLIKQLRNLYLSELGQLTGFQFDEVLFSARKETIFTSLNSCEKLFNWLNNLTMEKAVEQRLKTQKLFSILLEADKAFLALSKEAREKYKARRFATVKSNIINEFLRDEPKSKINSLRTKSRLDALTTLSNNNHKNLFTLTLPTGLGKTLIAASLAFQLRRKKNCQIIIVLPFLSIVDQTSKIYSEVLNYPDESTLMQSHSLSDIGYLKLEDNDAEFFLDTWQSDIIITTFDQVLLALLSSKAKHQIRFHHLCNSIIIFDEIQALPTHLWSVMQHALCQLSKSFSSTIIIMSATQPNFINDAQELIPNFQKVFQSFNRYQLVLKHKHDMRLTNFIEMLKNRYKSIKEKRVLITLNTRESARRVFDELQDENHPVYLLSADVIPLDRLKIIKHLKEHKSEYCLVVSTQVVEAGVDIDMDLVIRDFAPLDSLIQVAGRCNRNNLKPHCDVEIYSLTNGNDNRYSSMVYRKTDGSPDISLQETRKVLEGQDIVKEENILDLCRSYFSAIRHLGNLGQTHTKDWAYFREHLNVSNLLRGEQYDQYQFIIAERDPKGGLEKAVVKALNIEDRWQRRRALKNLAPRLALVTVSIWGNKHNFNPNQYARSVGPFWFVHDGFYKIERGLDINTNTSFSFI